MGRSRRLLVVGPINKTPEVLSGVLFIMSCAEAFIVFLSLSLCQKISISDCSSGNLALASSITFLVNSRWYSRTSVLLFVPM